MRTPADPRDPGRGTSVAADRPQSAGTGAPIAIPPGMDGGEVRRRRERRFLYVLLGCAAALSILVGAGLIAAWSAGSIVVQVDERGRGGDQVRLRVPAAAGHLALLCLPDRAFAGPARDRIFRRGKLGILARELERVPDGTVLVEVESPRERVRISRERDLLLIRVDSPDENVRVEVPVKLAGAALKRVERIAADG